MFWALLRINLLNVFRDRVFHGIITASFLFLVIPSVSNISMRMVTELALNLSVSLTSFILLLLTLLVGGTSIWKDIDRRYSYSVLSLPVTRDTYLLAKFASIALFFMLTVMYLLVLTYFAVTVASYSYPPNRPVVWGGVVIAYIFEYLKYLLLASVAFLFSSVSTSFFLPIFGTISIYLVGSVSQQVFDYVSVASTNMHPVVLYASKILYYLLPNFAAFDFKVNALYSVSISVGTLMYVLVYWLLYTVIMITSSIAIYRKREMF